MEILTTRSTINWPAQVKKNALTFLKGLESLEFIYCMVTLSRSLVYL